MYKRQEIALVVADRQENGYRNYSEKHIQRLSFLRRAREFGFCIEDCRTLLTLYDDNHRISADVKSLAAHRLEELKLKAAEIQGLASTLEGLVSRCAGDNDPDCPIIEELANSAVASARDRRG